MTQVVHAGSEVELKTVFSGVGKRLFVVQPVRRHARPIRCEGVGFSFTARRDQLAFVGGTPTAAFVGVNGARTYPRRGRTVITSNPVWSRDGRSLAFLESPTGGTPRLVLLAQPDNSTGDTTWTLPAAAHVSGARVFWAGPGKLVVGKTALHPVFAASFTREQARNWDP